MRYKFLTKKCFYLFILLIFIVLLLTSSTNNLYNYRFEKIVLNKIDQFGNKYILKSNNSIRRNYAMNIGIFVAIERRNDIIKYRTAIDTLKCYTAMHRYSLDIIYGDDISQQLQQKCQQTLVSDFNSI